jgi:hypothetical protein
VSKPYASKRRTYALGTVFVIALIAVALLVLAPTHHAIARTASSLSLPPQSGSQSKASQAKTMTPAARERLQATFAALPLAFEQNQGQTDPQVKYMARAGGYTLYLTSSDTVFSFASTSSKPMSRPKQMMEQRLLGYSRATHKVIRRQPTQNRPSPSSVASVRMHIVNGSPAANVEGRDLLSGKVNYFIGNNPHNWHKNVPEFARVSYSGIYPGVDLVYHGQQKELEFDFIVAPNANPAPIDLSFSGTQHMRTDAAGNLLLASAAGEIMLHKPVAYQQQNVTREMVDARFVLKSNHEVGFVLGSYDHSRELVIDPSLSYATYIGGNGDDEAYGIALDSGGNSYITGESDSSSGFPGGNPSAGGYDAFVVKINANGTLGYTTFVGGSGDDLGSSIAVTFTPAGVAYVAGITTSTDLPVSAGAAQSTSGSAAGANCTTGTGTAPCTDGFIFQLDSTGAPAYVTYLGGNNDDGAFGIAIDGSGNAYVTGFTFSANFPLQSALYSALNDDVASNPPFEDAFVTEVNPTGTAWVYSTYLGGENNDFGAGIAVDFNDNAYVTGGTYSTDFPTTTGAFQTICGTDGNCNAGSGKIFSDVFVTKLAAGGGTLSYSTYLGGGSDDTGLAVNLDAAANVYVTGQTTADNTNFVTDNFPIVGGFQTTYGNGTSSAGSNAFVSELNPAGQGSSDLLYSSYLGGSTADAGLGIAVDNQGNAYVTGSTLSSDFPTVAAFQATLNGNSDAFITHVAPGGASLTYSSYLGGPGDENFDSSTQSFLGGAVTLYSLGSFGTYLTGTTSSSTGFPVTGSPLQATYGGGPFDAFTATVTTADFTISATTPTSVAPGASGTSTVTLTELNGYNLPVNLTCSVTGTGSPLPACGSFSPASPITPTSGGAMTTLTITTTGASAALVRPSKFFYAMWLPIAGMSLIGMGFSSTRSRRKKLLGFLMIGIVMSALFLMPACGGSSSGGGGGGGGGSTGTPAGNYTVTITGTDANNLSNSTAVTLTVN